MAQVDNIEVQLNLIRLYSSPEFAIQTGIATDEILAILDAMAAKNPRPKPAPAAPTLPPPVPSKSIPINILPKNPIIEAASKAKEALDRAAQNIGRSIGAAATNVRQSAQAAATNVRQTTQAAAQSVGSAAKSAAKAVGKLFRSDRRLKTDLNLIGRSPSGINIYEFRFIADPNKKYQGVLADELLGTPFESAVYFDSEGYYAVDYDNIDVTFKEVSQL